MRLLFPARAWENVERSAVLTPGGSRHQIRGSTAGRVVQKNSPRSPPQLAARATAMSTGPGRRTRGVEVSYKEADLNQAKTPAWLVRTPLPPPLLHLSFIKALSLFEEAVTSNPSNSKFSSRGVGRRARLAPARPAGLV